MDGAGDAEGVVCRRASLARLGVESGPGPHEAWSELAVYPERAKRPPDLLRRRSDLDWL